MIELMIAMTIGVFLLGALALVLSNNSRTRHEIEKSTGQIQNARYALQVIADDLGNAGFYGEATIPKNKPLPALCPIAADLDDARAYPVQGADNIAATPAACAAIGAILPGSDLLALRRTSTCAVDTPDCDAFTEGLPHLQQPACPADCSNRPCPWIETIRAALTGRTRSCSAGVNAPIYRLYSRLYFLAPSNRTNDGIPTLKRAELTANGYVVTPIAEGVEHLHFEFGIDTDNDGEPDVYPDVSSEGALSAGTWPDVVAVRVHLLVRNASPTTGLKETREYNLGGEVVKKTDDPYKRQAYSTTIRLNNIAGRREYLP